eukprot:scaffold1372_cov351-Pavlova_lutheri.AAC.1
MDPVEKGAREDVWRRNQSDAASENVCPRMTPRTRNDSMKPDECHSYPPTRDAVDLARRFDAAFPRFPSHPPHTHKPVSHGLLRFGARPGNPALLDA